VKLAASARVARAAVATGAVRRVNHEKSSRDEQATGRWLQEL